MTSGLETTFRHLSKTKNDAAATLLLAALDSDHAQIAEHALTALLDRRGDAGSSEILSRLHTMEESWIEIIRKRPGRLTGALRNAIVGSDDQQCENACHAISEFRDYDLMPVLINAAEDSANEKAGLMASTVLELAEALYDELAQPRDYKQRRDPHLVRKSISSSLEASVARFAKHQRTEILEAFLILTARDNVVLRKILSDPYHEAYLATAELLTKSERRGVMRLVLAFLDDRQAPSAAMTILSRRGDQAFVSHLLKKIGFEPTSVAKNNLRRIESMPWITESYGLLDEFDDAGQHAAVQLAIHCHLPQDDTLNMLEHVLTQGTPGGSVAAAAGLAKYSGSKANHLALDALDHVDPRVQSAVIPHLRQRGIPGVMNRLLALLESPHELVRNAARDQLVEFKFERYAEAFDNLTDDVRRTTGQLVKVVDPRARALLSEEFGVASRTRRLRALAMTEAMGMVVRLESEVIGLLGDDEHLVRVEAARALGGCQSEAAIEALRDCLADRSVAVQEAAEFSLQEIGRRVARAAEEARQEQTL
ncbi:MAG: hypothetical protein DWQ31_19005 [Planctomycetota bacterium]|nr:MAG: hypothetical protein DWQ31_19005 [Planctomycetota bacterium]REJ93176.1 MAG: hypothetical protein DWQ35_10890 [Planctomycetota bacterium]